MFVKGRFRDVSCFFFFLFFLPPLLHDLSSPPEAPVQAALLTTKACNFQRLLGLTIQGLRLARANA